MEQIHEECGVFGIFNREAESVDTARCVYYALYALQHRGQEACGIAVNDGNLISLYKDLGLVHEVFDEKILSGMKGSIAIGHARYSTTGGNNRRNIQPLGVDYIKGSLVIAHNGNVSNAALLRQELEQQGAVFQCTSDTEVIAFLIAKERLTANSVEEAVARVAPRLEGSFSLLVMSPKKLIALRDPKGMRPLCMGHLGKSPVFASESCALDSIGASFDRDVRPGELIVVDESGERVMESGINPDASKCALCVFEHIYFARPDSVIDGQNVYQARLEAGRILARSHPVQADLVIGVPDSGLAAAIGFAQESGIPYGEGLVKNRYIGRTFIQPTQNGRESAVSIKLSALRRSVEGKRVVLIDDSIVRGTQLRETVDFLYESGAEEVHMRSACPPIMYSCKYLNFSRGNSDMELLVRRVIQELEGDEGHKHLDEYSDSSTERGQCLLKSICEKFGFDSLGYQSLDGVLEAIGIDRNKVCTYCWNGKE